MTARAAPAPLPPATTVGLQGWLRQNLFSSLGQQRRHDRLGGRACPGSWSTWAAWVFVEADWTVIISRVPLYIVGLYPYEGYWRLCICLLLISVLLGMSWRAWPNAARRFAFAFRRRSCCSSAYVPA